MDIMEIALSIPSWSDFNIVHDDGDAEYIDFQSHLGLILTSYLASPSISFTCQILSIPSWSDFNLSSAISSQMS